MYPVFRKKAFCARGYLAEKTDTRDNAIESEIKTFFLRYFLRRQTLYTLLSWNSKNNVVTRCDRIQGCRIKEIG